LAILTLLLRFQHDFPIYDKPHDYGGLSPSLDQTGVDLLIAMLQFDPAKRVSAADAMNHPYFANLSPAIKQMGEHK
jgi:serine/threonine protein kinase